jgi:hypothetical protein
MLDGNDFFPEVKHPKGKLDLYFYSFSITLTIELFLKKYY